MRSPFAPVAVVAALLALAGCTPQTGPAPQQTAGAPTSQSPSPQSPSTEPTVEPPDSDPLPVPGCEQLVSAEQMYEYNSNVALSPDYSPLAGSVVARVASTGVACGWVNLSSNEVISLAVGAPDEAVIADFEAEFSAWSPATWDGASGYFGTSGGQATAAIVIDGYVVVSSSTAYVEATDAAPIVNAAVSSL